MPDADRRVRTIDDVDVPPRLLCLGDLNADITITADGTISIGSDTPGSVVMSGGGSAANVAAWAAEAGTPSRFVGVIGDDPLGDFLVEELTGHGTEARVIRRPATASRAIAAIVGPDGNRSMVSALDPSTVLGVDDIDPSWFTEVGWVHLTAYTYLQDGGRQVFAALVETIGSLDIAWSVDPSSAQMLALQCTPDDALAAFAGAAIIFPNQDEATWLTGADAAVEAAEQLLDAAETAVVTCGADGAVVARRGTATFRLDAAPTTLVNTLGCGDAFAAGFLSGRLEGLDDRACAERAATVAARAAAISSSR